MQPGKHRPAKPFELLISSIWKLVVPGGKSTFVRTIRRAKSHNRCAAGTSPPFEIATTECFERVVLDTEAYTLIA
jgi:hypothetical protein